MNGWAALQNNLKARYYCRHIRQLGNHSGIHACMRFVNEFFCITTLVSAGRWPRGPRVRLQEPACRSAFRAAGAAPPAVRAWALA